MATKITACIIRARDSKVNCGDFLFLSPHPDTHYNRCDSPWRFRMAKKKLLKTWMVPSPRQKAPKAAVPERIKADLDARAKKLVKDVLKPKYVQPPPKRPQFNYITDVWLKWLGSTLYFGVTYACPGPTAISPSFESKFARMEHVGGGRFALSYMRHNDKWLRLFLSLTVAECLDAIRNDWHFQLGCGASS